MWAAVSSPVKLEKDALIWNVSADGSRVINTLPVAGELLGGTAFAPDRVPPNNMGFALATDAEARAARRVSVDETYRISRSSLDVR
jgi:hypothetical protein